LLNQIGDIVVIVEDEKSGEEVWLNNFNNYDKLVLYAVCQNKECSYQCPVVANYYDYRHTKSISPHDYLQTAQPCIKCQTKDSLYVYDLLNNLKL
jgi:hypothetical protein